jgi:hypothetical protein
MWAVLTYEKTERNTVDKPIVLISHHRIRDGRLEEFKELSRQVMKRIEVNKPGTLAQLSYLDEARAEVSFVHLFPDAEAMDAHLEGVGERTNQAYEYLRPVGFEIYGTLSDNAMAIMHESAVSEAYLKLNP